MQVCGILRKYQGELIGFSLIVLVHLIFFGYVAKVSVSHPDSGSVEDSVSASGLSEWEVFSLALADVESEYYPDVVSSAGAVGVLQQTQHWVGELNRLDGGSRLLGYCFVPDSALLYLNQMQPYYNRGLNLDVAIRLYNPRAGKWYSKRVREAMARVRRYEEFRELVVKCSIK